MTTQAVKFAERLYGPRFPFQPGPHATPDEVRDRINTAIKSVDAMLHKLTLQRFREADRDAMDEVVQRARINLWERALPRFDAWRGTKVSSFAYTATVNFLRCEMRAKRRQRIKNARQPHVCLDAPEAHDAAAPDQAGDKRIERLADSVLDWSRDRLTRKQHHVLGRVLAMQAEHPNMTVSDIAEALDIESTSLHMILARSRDRLVSVLDDLD